MSTVEKRCGCPETKWTKCSHPAWYLKKFRHAGREYAPNVTRWASVVLQRDITAKFEAEAVAAEIKSRIRARTYVVAETAEPAAPAVVLAPKVTLAALGERFAVETIDANDDKAANSKANDRAILKDLYRFAVDRGRLGDQPATSLTIQDLIDYKTEGCAEYAASTWNKRRTLLGQFCSWLKWEMQLEDPIAIAPPAKVKRLQRKKARQRRRRIDDREWANIIEAAREVRTHEAGSRLLAILVALWETGCRIGELLALQWADVQIEKGHFLVRAEEEGASKTGEGRPIEISAPLADLLLTIRKDPAGRELPRSAYVFGTVVGERVWSVYKAFHTTVLRANNHEPAWAEKGKLTTASWAALERIDLHLHDIRHEAACRWHESGTFTLADIQVRLGHTTLAQTATYVHAATGSTKRAQQAFDAQRKAAAQAQATGTTGQSGDKRGDKEGTNSRSGTKRGQGLRLVKAGKL